MQLQSLSQRSVQFDLERVDASVANALRRVLIAEVHISSPAGGSLTWYQVPTVAFENVYVWNNTSVIHDEVLAHRLGLVPLNIDPRKLSSRTCEWRCCWYPHLHLPYAASDQPTDLDTVVFRLNAKCEETQSLLRVPLSPRICLLAPTVTSLPAEISSLIVFLSVCVSTGVGPTRGADECLQGSARPFKPPYITGKAATWTGDRSGAARY